MLKTFQHIRVVNRVRKREGKPCKHCGQPITIGEEFVSIVIDTGFNNSPVGNFHKVCWPLFEPSLGKHINTKWHR